jgi:hypothetical protein
VNAKRETLAILIRGARRRIVSEERRKSIGQPFADFEARSAIIALNFILNSFEDHLMLKIKNAKKTVQPRTRYLDDVRMAVEMDQGYPLTALQDVTLEQMASEEKYTVKRIVDRLIELRPKSRT